MAIPEDLEAKIKRYYYVEKWLIGTISQQLGVHHSTIKRVLSQAGVEKNKLLTEPSMIDAYLPFVLETLKKYPKLTASRLYAMVCDRGYPGGLDHFRHLIALYRPKKIAEAYARLLTLPAEQAQVDWGHFGYITIGKAKRALFSFCHRLELFQKSILEVLSESTHRKFFAWSCGCL